MAAKTSRRGWHSGSLPAPKPQTRVLLLSESPKRCSGQSTAAAFPLPARLQSKAGQRSRAFPPTPGVGGRRNAGRGGGNRAPPSLSSAFRTRRTCSRASEGQQHPGLSPRVSLTSRGRSELRYLGWQSPLLAHGRRGCLPPVPGCATRRGLVALESDAKCLCGTKRDALGPLGLLAGPFVLSRGGPSKNKGTRYTSRRGHF